MVPAIIQDISHENSHLKRIKPAIVLAVKVTMHVIIKDIMTENSQCLLVSSVILTSSLVLFLKEQPYFITF